MANQEQMRETVGGAELSPPTYQKKLFSTEQGLEEVFEEWIEKNPTIYSLFKQFAQEAKDAGFECYSARTIVERIRWHVKVETRGDKEFKINDHHTPYFSRKLMRECRRFAGFFELRKLGGRT